MVPAPEGADPQGPASVPPATVHSGPPPATDQGARPEPADPGGPPGAGTSPAAGDDARRAAQDGAAELVRMGIDPQALGLEPLPAPAPEPAAAGRSAGSRRARGVAAPPPAARSTPDRAAPATPPPWLDSALSRPIADLPAPPDPATGGQVGAVERLVARTAAAGPPRSWRDLVRAITRGLVEPGATATVEQERQLVARVRLRPPEPRIIAFLAGKGGVGTSTTAAGVAVTLVSLRADTAALVSARSGTGSLGQRLLGQPAPAVPALVGTAPVAPLWMHDRLAVVDGSPWHTPTPPETLLRLLELLRGQHPLTVVDVGNQLGETADRTLGRADQVVLVTSASPDAVATTRNALSRVHQVDPFRLATVVVAVVCLSRRQHQRIARRLRAELGMQAARIVRVGFDPWLADGDRIEPARLRATTRRAYLEIAGLVVEPGGGDQWFSQPRLAGPGAGQ